MAEAQRLGAEALADHMGSGAALRPADEAGFSAIERGIIARARRAGFAVEMLYGAGQSRRLVGRRPGTGSGLIRFSITAGGDYKSETWVQFVYWPPRRAKVAELRAELQSLAEEGRR